MNLDFPSSPTISSIPKIESIRNISVKWSSTFECKGLKNYFFLNSILI